MIQRFAQSTSEKRRAIELLENQNRAKVGKRKALTTISA